ncbi:MAG: hypothetical protein ACEQSK_04390 [Sphingomonadaceae bacterium]
MLLRNDLLHYRHPTPRTVRILWIAPEQGRACVFDVAATSAEVEQVALATLLADLTAGRAHRLLTDPYLVLQGRSALPAKHLELRDRAWHIIEGLTRREPEIYDPRQRGQLIAHYTALHGVSHPTIYRYLRRYWQRGQTPNALLPDYSNSGGRGKVRAASAGIKRGRPRKDGSDPGLNADDEIRRVFRVATAHYAARHARFSRRAAYQAMLGEFFDGRSIDVASGRVLPGVAAVAPLPTFGQFNYWLDQDEDRPPAVLRRRGAGRDQGPPREDSFNAAAPWLPRMPLALGGVASAPRNLKLAPALALPPGRPGAGFYLDVQQADIQLVSVADRSLVAGPPLLYVVVDLFSRMITGLHVALGAPAWPQALAALAHCGMDKQRYCAQLGRPIEAAEWPCQHLPDTLYARPALIESRSSEALLNNFNLRCLPSEAAPDDWHAVLQKRVQLMPAPAAQPAGSRLDGVLDLGQFTRIVTEAVLYYNNQQPLPHAGGATPRQLWEWGVQHRGGALRTYAEPLLRFALLA